MRFFLLISLLAAALYAGQFPAAETLLEEYKQAGAGPFSAAAGEKLWFVKNTVKGQERSCVSCHTADLTKGGKHAKSGEAIDPMAPSVQTDRFRDIKHTQKWFKRNCKWVFERECTPQEKGDYLMFILSK